MEANETVARTTTFLDYTSLRNVSLLWVFKTDRFHFNLHKKHSITFEELQPRATSSLAVIRYVAILFTCTKQVG